MYRPPFTSNQQLSHVCKEFANIGLRTIVPCPKMPDKKNKRGKLVLFPKSPTPPDNPSGTSVTNTPTPRSVANYLNTFLSPQSAAECQPLLHQPTPENEVVAGPSDASLQQGELEIDGKKRTSFLPSTLVAPLKLRTWPSLAQHNDSSSGPASSRSESWGVRFISDVGDDGSADHASGHPSPGKTIKPFAARVRSCSRERRTKTRRSHSMFPSTREIQY